MAYMTDEDRTKVKRIFENLQNPVKLICFTQEFECMYCRETRELVEEVAELSPLLQVEVFDFAKDKSEVDSYKIDKIPAMVVEGDEDYGIRFFGMPTGYEFSSLLEDIVMESKRDPGLEEDAVKFLAELDREIHLQVFVSVTCSYCPVDVKVAHRMAMGSPLVTADVVEMQEFPHLTQKYKIDEIPRTVINDEMVVRLKGSELVAIREIKKYLNNR